MRSSLTPIFVPFCGRFLIFLLVAALASVTSSKATIRQGAEFELEDTSEGSAEGFGIEIETLSELEEFGGKFFEKNYLLIISTRSL